MTEEKVSSPSAHWRRRSANVRIPPDQAIRQGEITRAAFVSLGKDAAIEFLNNDDPELGGRPLALAIESDSGAASVHTRLQQIATAKTGGGASA